MNVVSGKGIEMLDVKRWLMWLWLSKATIALDSVVRMLLVGMFAMSWGVVSAGTDPIDSLEDEYHQQGRELYNYRCYYCHGYSGDAKTLASSYMDPSPTDFTRVGLDMLSRARMIESVGSGVVGTAMVSFTHYLNPKQITQVVDFIRREFMLNKKPNTRYHTAENGWPDHRRYASAFPFAIGELAIDAPQEQMSELQRQGLRLFMNSCITCHDHGRVENEGPIWELRAISYPRNNFSYTEFDGVTSASVYAEHDRPQSLDGPTETERQGETLFQQNCAFCHAADGTGKNWIGSFLDSHPRDLTDPRFMSGIDRPYLRRAIADGLVGTSMPAWKSVLSAAQIDALIDYISRAFHPIDHDPVKVEGK